MAVDRFLVPGFGYAIHVTVGVWDGRLDRRLDVCEEGEVLSLIVPCVPLVLVAISADFKNKSQLFL